MDFVYKCSSIFYLIKYLITRNGFLTVIFFTAITKIYSSSS